MPTIYDSDTGEKLPLPPDPARSKEIELLNQQYECAHSNQALRRVTNKGGGKAIRYQCLDCGELSSNSVPAKNAPTDIQDADIKLRERRHQEHEDAVFAINLKYARRLHDQKRQGLDDYSKYLQSDKWKAKRAKVMRRANNICEGCREAKATEVHHLTYIHLKDELLFELVALCHECHARCHADGDEDMALDLKQNDWDILLGTKCSSCRWGGERDGLEWCGNLDISAAEAQSGENECSKVMEFLK